MTPGDAAKDRRLESVIVSIDRLSSTLARQQRQIQLEKVGSRKEQRPPSPRGSRPWLRAKAERDKKKAEIQAVMDKKQAELQAQERAIIEAEEAARIAAEEAEARRIAIEQAAIEKEANEKGAKRPESDREDR